MTKYQVEVALQAPSYQMKQGMKHAINENDPAAVDVEGMSIRNEKDAKRGMGKEGLQSTVF